MARNTQAPALERGPPGAVRTTETTESAPLDRAARAARAALEARLATAEAQAMRATQDWRAQYEAEQQRRRELEAAQAQQLRLATDFTAAYHAERTQRDALQAVYLQTLHVLAHAVEVRDDYTGGHIERVRTYSLAIADALGLDAPTRHQVDMGAVLHDLGKIGVPDAVLGKPGQLTDDEWGQMRTHPEKGATLLREVTFLAQAIAAVEAHHERWDGRGYPHGLRGEAIPLLGRIVAVADTFDAMTSDRPYRRGLPVAVALAEIERGKGAQFDPAVAQAFLLVGRWDDLRSPGGVLARGA